VSHHRPNHCWAAALIRNLFPPDERRLTGTGPDRKRAQPPKQLRPVSDRSLVGRIRSLVGIIRLNRGRRASPSPTPSAIYPNLSQARGGGNGDLGCGWLFRVFGRQTARVRMRQACCLQTAALTGQLYATPGPTVSAITAPRCPNGLGGPMVESIAVWCSISAFSLAPTRTTTAESHIHIIMPITAPSAP
jgi:hypothetical protein